MTEFSVIGVKNNDGRTLGFYWRLESGRLIVIIAFREGPFSVQDTPANCRKWLEENNK